MKKKKKKEKKQQHGLGCIILLYNYENTFSLE